MKSAWSLLIFSCLLVFVIFSSESSSEQDYGLIIKLCDGNRNNSVVIISGDYLFQETTVKLPQMISCQEGLWDEVLSIWKDCSSPEDVGCYTVSFVPKIIKARGSCFEFFLSKQTESTLKKLCELILDDTNICIMGAFLIKNEFLDECNLTTYQKKSLECPSKNEEFSEEFGKSCLLIDESLSVKTLCNPIPEAAIEINPLISFITELDEQEIRDALAQRSKLSDINMYACNVGTLMLLKYMSIKESIASWWSRTKEFIRL
jgi:hypothetical protein